MAHLIVKTNEAGKQIVLAANVPSVIKVCNIEEVNTDPSTFQYIAEDGEFRITRRVVAEVSGTLYLITGTDESADLTIDLLINGSPVYRVYTGITNQRNIAPFHHGYEYGDVVELAVTSPDDVTIETDDAEHFIMI